MANFAVRHGELQSEDQKRQYKGAQVVSYASQITCLLLQPGWKALPTTSDCLCFYQTVKAMAYLSELVHTQLVLKNTSSRALHFFKGIF